MRNQILNNVRKYFRESEKGINCTRKLIPGKDYLPSSAKLLDENDLVNLVDACLDLWLTSGRFADKFEQEFANFSQRDYCVLVNSGSSANLLAIAVLTAAELGKKKLSPGDEVITIATSFPTTINPIILYGGVPVFIDIEKIELGTYQMDVSFLEAALSDRTKAVLVTHTLGNVAKIKEIKEFCERHNLWLIEDCCDAVGAEYDGRKVGTFGDLATFSFYPAHHMTMGEGGALLLSDPLLAKIAVSFRDWGRDCHCKTGQDNRCGDRFSFKKGELPFGYDHKYIYTQLGHNLKVTEMQAALGLSQLKKLPYFITKRKDNFSILRKKLQCLDGGPLILPTATPTSNPSWFGMPLSINTQRINIERNIVCALLEKNKIGTRVLFGGNLVKQPAYENIKMKLIGDLENSNYVMKNTFWVGIHPRLSEEHLEYIAQKITQVLG